MALQDFIKKLKEQDDSDVIYSKPPEQTIKIIPPVKPVDTLELPSNNDHTKIIPPVTSNDTKKPTTIKFKLNVVNSSEQRVVESPIVKPEPIQQPKQQIITPPKQKPSTQESEKPQTQTIIKQPVKKDEVEILFERSGTNISKKEIWLDYYEKAKASRKQNSVVDRIRAGKFAITYDNQVLMLPDYNTYQKSTKDILNDKWLKN